MEYVMDLSRENIYKAIDTCIKKDRYRVGIACISRHIKLESDILHNILKSIENIEEYVQEFICGSGRCEIHFKNGSFIRIIDASTNARGIRVNSLLIDAEVPNEVIKCVLMPFLCKYYER